MKANRKFIDAENDEAVSPVIATILMVAITVVLGATVYVWVSGFGQSGKQAPTLAISKVSTKTGAPAGAIYQINAISAANVPWTDLTFKLNGNSLSRLGPDCATALSGNAAAGDQFCALNAAAGDTLTLSHTPTGSVLATVTV